MAYSGGKCIRGPQAAGLLLGDKSLLQGAWINSAPHHAFGRSVKVGKEEIMGMLAAVEMWVKRDHKAEWAQWEALARPHRHQREARGRRHHQRSPSLPPTSPTAPRNCTSSGTAAKLGITGQEIGKLVLDTEPRIVVARASGARPGNMASTVSIVPYQMMAGDEKVVADRLYALLSKPPKMDPPPALEARPPASPASGICASISSRLGQPHLDAGAGRRKRLVGTHQGEFAAGDLSGTVAANTVRFQSSLPTDGTRVAFQFAGTAEGGKMSGTVGLAEYGQATWSAERHPYRNGTRRG